MRKISLKKVFYNRISLTPGNKPSFKICIFGLLVFLLDFFSKRWIVAHVPFAESIPVFDNVLGIQFCITHAINRGAAWGLFSAYPNALIALRIGIILLILSYFLLGRIPRQVHLFLCLILGGAVGNVCDFFVFGHVVDFFAFTFWGYAYPVFNLADSAIFCGVTLFVLQWIRVKNKQFAK